MGLAITAYSRLTHVGKHTDWCEDYENHIQAFAYDSFPASFRGIPVLATRPIYGSSFIEGGCYAPTAETQTHQFDAGSYGGYNRWRADLQAQFNPGTHPDGPFYELIFFADNEGTIGPDAAKDLQADFEQHAASYRGEDWAQQKYADWLRACDLAADSGLIKFH
jgi:hypothetical protein